MEWPRFNPHDEEVVVPRNPSCPLWAMFPRRLMYRCYLQVVVDHRPQLELTLRLDFPRSWIWIWWNNFFVQFCFQFSQLVPSSFFGFLRTSGDLYEYTPFFCIQLCSQNSEERLETVVIYFPRNRSVHIWPIWRKIVKRSYLCITLTKKFKYFRKWKSNFN